MKYLTLLFSLVTSVAMAGSAQLNWTKPTLNDDGSALTDCTGYKIYFANTATAVPSSVPVTVTGCNTQTFTFNNIPAGTWYFGLSTVSTAGGEGPISNLVSKVIVAPKPLPPSNLAITATTVYYSVQQLSKLVAIPVGTAPPDTACDPQQSITASGVQYFAVDRSKVTWYGSVKPLVVFAQCS